MLSASSAFKIDIFHNNLLHKTLTNIHNNLLNKNLINLVNTHTPNKGLDFHFESFASIIHVVQSLFARWNHEVLICVQSMSLHSSGCHWCNVLYPALHNDRLRNWEGYCTVSVESYRVVMVMLLVVGWSVRRLVAGCWVWLSCSWYQGWLRSNQLGLLHCREQLLVLLNGCRASVSQQMR